MTGRDSGEAKVAWSGFVNLGLDLHCDCQRLNRAVLTTRALTRCSLKALH